MEIVTHSDGIEFEGDSDVDVNNSFEYESDNDELNTFPPNKSRVSLHVDASRTFSNN